MFDPSLHLFIDDRHVRTLFGLRREFGKIEKFPEPVLEDIRYPCVIYSADERTFRMWYQADKVMADKNDPSKPLVDGHAMQHEMYLCYAESSDGLHWETPALNRLEVDRYGGNNLDTLEGRFIQLRMYGSSGTVFGVTCED